jgi:hypothetical protein
VRSSLSRLIHRLFDRPRCDMTACENPKHGRVHFQKGTGAPYVPNNLLVKAILEHPEVRALQRLGRIGFTAGGLMRRLAPTCKGCKGSGIIEGGGGSRPCFLCNQEVITAPVYRIGGPTNA